MRKQLLTLVRCPACHGALQIKNVTARHEEIEEGELECRQCQAIYAVQAGMPYLYVDNELWQPKRGEAEGWTAIHKEKGIYEPVAKNSTDLRAPYINQEPWIQVARSFDVALEILAVKQGMRVLDLGAGRGWAAKHFALYGCEVVALDITSDENIGLGRGQALMEDANTFFERVIGDGENLPLAENAFDIVFCCGSLHHSHDLLLLLANIYRVLQPGGLLCAINEPCVSILTDKVAVLAQDAAQELRLGINETRPSIVDYYRALAAHGLEPLWVLPAISYHMDEIEMQAWGQDVGAFLGSISWNEPWRAFWRIYNFAKNRLRLVNRQMQMPLPPTVLQSKRNQMGYDIALWIDAELLLLARKPDQGQYPSIPVP